MILIADSGSTKTTWCLCDKGELLRQMDTIGMNPYFQPEEEIGQHLSDILLPGLNCKINEIQSVFFYGAGCVYDKTELMRNAIKRYIPADMIHINTDLLGAARGLYGKESGIACIMGTGSNSCLYDGERIIENVSSLGYILGDEGSGSDLGKHLVGDLLKNMLPDGLKEKFLKQYDLTTAQIIDRVYRRPFPNRFLASLSPFLSENIHEYEIQQLVYNRFKSFFIRNIMKYDYKKYKISFVGSIAFHYRMILEEIATEAGVELGFIEKSPMKGLIAYHSGLQVIR